LSGSFGQAAPCITAKKMGEGWVKREMIGCQGRGTAVRSYFWLSSSVGMLVSGGQSRCCGYNVESEVTGGRRFRSVQQGGLAEIVRDGTEALAVHQQVGAPRDRRSVSGFVETLKDMKTSNSLQATKRCVLFFWRWWCGTLRGPATDTLLLLQNGGQGATRPASFRLLSASKPSYQYCRF